MTRKAFSIRNKSVEQKLNEIQEGTSTQEEVEVQPFLPIESRKTKTQSSVVEKLNQTVKKYKRIGFDIDADIDNAVEYLVDNDLKDLTTKKEILNEVIAIGWPIWKRQLQDSAKK